MNVTRDLAALPREPYPVLAIGNFDGLHLGHQSLLRAVIHRAQATAGTSMVLTFDPHPLTVVAPNLRIRFLTALDEKLQRLEAIGIDHVVCLEFSTAMAELTPDEFVSRILHDHIGVRELFVGETFRFGRERQGTIDDLMRVGRSKGYRVRPIVPVQVDGETVSSSKIRALIQEGNVAAAARFLGRRYTIHGRVQGGTRQGRAMGYPTANVALPPDRVTPPDGVYATVTEVDRLTYESVSYIGRRPTFRGDVRLLEVHLLDAEPDLYGQEVTVAFSERIRGDLEFANAADLSRQIQDDIDQARRVLKASIG